MVRVPEEAECILDSSTAQKKPAAYHTPLAASYSWDCRVGGSNLHPRDLLPAGHTWGLVAVAMVYLWLLRCGRVMQMHDFPDPVALEPHVGFVIVAVVDFSLGRAFLHV